MQMYCVCWCSAASLSVVGALMFAFSAIEVLYRTKTLNPCPPTLTYFFVGAEVVFGVTFIICIPFCYFTNYQHESLLRAISFILLAILVLIVAIMFTIVSISLSYNATRRAAMGSQVTWELCRLCAGAGGTALIILTLLAVQLPSLLHNGPITRPMLDTFDPFDSEAPGLLTYIITVLFFIMVSSPRRSAQKPGLLTSPSQYRYSLSGEKTAEKTVTTESTRARQSQTGTMRPTASNPAIASAAAAAGKPGSNTPSPKTSSRALPVLPTQPTQQRSGSITASGTLTPGRISIALVGPKTRAVAAVSPGLGLANVNTIASPSASFLTNTNATRSHHHTKSGGWTEDSYTL